MPTKITKMCHKGSSCVVVAIHQRLKLAKLHLHNGLIQFPHVFSTLCTPLPDYR